MDLLSDKYAEAAKEFVADAAAAGSPFFLYYAASHVHVPQNHHPRWDNFSKQAAERGAFGASLLEMDYEFGTIMDALREAVTAEYPRRHPEQAERYAVHVCRMVDGVKVLPGVD